MLPWMAAAALLSSFSAAAPMSSCTRSYDEEITAALPAAVHARLTAMKGSHARRAAAFLLVHDQPLIIGVDAARALQQPELPIMAQNTVMQFMVGKGYMVEHSALHELPGGERELA